MNKPIISIICAMDENRGIGVDGKLPWRLPEDLKHFRQLTTGHTVIMGRKTFDSILDYLGKPLPNRTNIVVTRNLSYSAAGATIATSIDKAINLAKKYETHETFIIGGGQIFTTTINQADKLYITQVKGHYQTDTYFPEIDPKAWSETARDDHGKFSFITYVRH